MKLYTNMIEQHRLLSWVADRIDTGELRTTLSDVLSPINAANLRESHQRIESGTARGKVVIENF